MKWFRVWHGSATDPKWRTISRRSSQPLVVVYAVWTFMLENASANATERGKLDNWNDEVAADCFGLETGQVCAIREAMNGLVLDGTTILNWEKFQPKREDSSAERAKAWRERNRTQPNAPERDTEKEQDKKEKEDARQEPRAEVLQPESKPDPRKAIFADGLRWLASSTKRPERTLRPLVGKWVKARGDPEVAAAFVAAQQANPVDPISWIEARLKSNEQRKPSDLQRRRSLAEAFLSVGAGGDDDDPSTVGETLPRLPHRASG